MGSGISVDDPSLKTYNEKLRHYTEEKKKLAEDLKNLKAIKPVYPTEAEIDALKTEVNKLKESKAELIVRLEKIKNDKEQSRAEKNSRLEAKISSLKSEIHENSEKKHKLVNEISTLEENHNHLAHEIQENHEKQKNLQKELDENELRLKDSTSLSAEISKLESLYESANSSLITNKEEIQGLKSTIIEIKDSDTLESDITALKSQIDEAKDRNSEITKKLANFSELQSLEMELKESKGYYKNLKQ